MKDTKKDVIIIQSSHWDYEWYFTMDHSTVLLTFHLKEIIDSLEKGLIKHFVLDGHTYLLKINEEVSPEYKNSLIKLNKEGKIDIGPWLIEPDLMVTAAESLVKNLLIGKGISEEYGGRWDVAYVPDTFGHAKNMPMIYKEFGIDRMIFWRGLSAAKHKYKEFYWEADNGSSVEALNIPEGYYAGGALYDKGKEFTGARGIKMESEDGYVKELLEIISKNSHIDDANLLSISGDARPVGKDIKELLEEYNEKFPEYNFKLGKYEDYFDKFNKSDMGTFSGEMLDSEASKIHRSGYSHRYDHRYLNDTCERLLINVLEPLVSMANNVGIDPKYNLIEKAWENLIKNSQHGPATGANNDIVNFHILERFERTYELITAYIDIVIRKISEKAYKDNSVALFNTSPYEKRIWKDIKLSTKEKTFILKDKNGNEIDYDLVEIEPIYSGSINRNPKDNDPNLYYYESTINIKYNLNPLSYQSLDVIEQKDKEFEINKVNEKFIDNDYYKIEISNNSLIFYDKKKDKVINDFIEIISDADDGDTYDFSNLPNPERIKIIPEVKKFDVIKQNETQLIEVASDIFINKDIDSWKENEPKKVKQEIKFVIMLHKESDLVNVKITTINKAKDHRLRLRFKSNLDFDTTFADVPYGFIKRPVTQPEINNWRELGWNEEPTGIYPVLTTVYVKDINEQEQLSFILKGIKEYEAFENGDIELTLYRSIGWLGKPKLERRPGIASGQQFKWTPTPDSQLLDKELKWEFNFTTNNCSNSELRRRYIEEVVDSTYYQNQELNKFTGPLKYFEMNKWDKPVKEDISLFEHIEINKDIEITIIKSLENGDILIRALNHSDSVVENPVIIMDEKIKKAIISNLAEENMGELEVNNGKVVLPSIEKFDIQTILIKKEVN